MGDDTLAAAYAKVQRADGGMLRQREVGLLLVQLRAEAVGVSTDAEWIQPTPNEIQNALRAMDANGDGKVSLEEFKLWYIGKGGEEYAEDPTLWGDDKEDAHEKYSTSNAKGAHAGVISDADLSGTRDQEPPTGKDKTRHTQRTPVPPSSGELGGQLVMSLGDDVAQLDRSLAIESAGVLWSGLALWDNDPVTESTDDDLHFSKGDIIHVVAEHIDEIGPEWAVGQLDGTQDASHHGFFPVEYVRRLTSEELQLVHRQRAAAPEFVPGLGPEPEPEPEPELDPHLASNGRGPPREAWQGSSYVEVAHAREQLEMERQQAAQEIAEATRARQQADEAGAIAKRQLAEAREAMKIATREAEQARAPAQRDSTSAMVGGRAMANSERQHENEATSTLVQQRLAAAQAEAHDLVVLAMEKVELSTMHDEELSYVRTESEAKIAAERAARLEAEKEIEDVRKLAEEQAARFAEQAARMAEQSKQAGFHLQNAGVLDDYESVLEQLAEEEAKREAAEKVVAETKAKLQAAKSAAAGVISAAWDSDAAQLEIANLKVQVERERAARTKAEAEAGHEVREGELRTAPEQVSTEQAARATAERQTQQAQAKAEASPETARQATSEAEAEKVARVAAVAAMVPTTEKLAELDQAAIRIQSSHRGRAARRELEKQRLAVIKIQSIHRGSAARKDLDEQHQAVTKVQSFHRENAAPPTGRVARINERPGQRGDDSKRPSVEEQELEAFTKPIVERGVEPEPESEPEPELSNSDAERNAASLTEAVEESQLLAEIMTELLAEHPELSSKQVQEAVVRAKGRRRVVARAEYEAYARAKLSARTLDDEMARAGGAYVSEDATSADEVRPKSVRGRAHRGGIAHISSGQSPAVDAISRRLPASTQRRIAKMTDESDTQRVVSGRRSIGKLSQKRKQHHDTAVCNTMGSPRRNAVNSSTPEPRPPASNRRGATPAPKGGRRMARRRQNAVTEGRDESTSTTSRGKRASNFGGQNPPPQSPAKALRKQRPKPKPPRSPKNGPAHSSTAGDDAPKGSNTSRRRIRSARRSEARIGAVPIRPAASGRILKESKRDQSDSTLVSDAHKLMEQIAELAGGGLDGVPVAENQRQTGEPPLRPADVLGELPPAMVDGLAEIMRTDNQELRRRAAAVAGVLLEGDIGTLQQALVDAVSAKKQTDSASLAGRQGDQNGARAPATEEEVLRAEWDRAAVAEHAAEQQRVGGSVHGHIRPNGGTPLFDCGNGDANSGGTSPRGYVVAGSSGAADGRNTASSDRSKNGRWSVGRRTPPHLRKDKDDNPGLTRAAYPDTLSRLSSGVAAPCFTDLTPLARARRQNAARVQALRASGGDAAAVLKVVRRHNRSQRKTDQRLSQPNVDRGSGAASTRHDNSRAHTENLPVFVKTKEPHARGKRAKSAPKERGGSDVNRVAASVDHAVEDPTNTERRPRQPRPASAHADSGGRDGKQGPSGKNQVEKQDQTAVRIASQPAMSVQSGINYNTHQAPPAPLWQQQQQPCWDYRQTSNQYGVSFEGKCLTHPSGRQSIADVPTVGATIMMAPRADSVQSSSSARATVTTAQAYGRRSAGGTRREQPHRGVRGTGRTLAVGVPSSNTRPNRCNSTPTANDAGIQGMQAQVREMEANANTIVQELWPSNAKAHDWAGGPQATVP